MATDRRHKWAQAAIAASVWSASEVILGFLLHSYRVPFKGQILTGIAIVILTALHKEWGGRGIIIRAALICALLKLLAPTPKIIGPVIAILAEGTLLELAICLFGRNPIAYLLGGGMAMTWTFTQKVGKLLFYYGQGMVELYSEILTTISSWIGFQLSPAIFLFFCCGGYFLLGSLFALVGIKISVNPTAATRNNRAATKNHKAPPNRAGKDKYYPTLIAIHFLFLLTILTFSNLSISIYASMAIYLSACMVFYRTRLGKTKNIRIWIPVFLVMILSGLFLHKGDSFFSIAGFYSGLTMGFRALFITFCVHFLIIELANPNIKRLLIKNEKGNLFAAIKMAQDFFQTVESSIDAKDFLKHPGRSIRQLIGIGLELERETVPPNQPRVIIVTGAVDSGKTSLLQQFLSHLENRNLEIGGVVAEGVWENGEKNGYEAVFLASGERRLLCRKGFSSPLNIGRFGFYEEVFASGEKMLTTEQEAALTILDEIGLLELAGKGWASALAKLLTAKKQLFIVVRRDFIEKVIQKFALTNYAIVDAEAEGSLAELVSHVDR